MLLLKYLAPISDISYMQCEKKYSVINKTTTAKNKKKKKQNRIDTINTLKPKQVEK